MKFIKKVLPLLLCAMMVVATFAVTASAAGGAANVSMTPSATEVNVGDTVTVTVSCTDMTVSSFATYLKFDKDLLECAKIVGARSTSDKFASNGYLFDSYEESWVKVTAMSTVAEANNIGQVGFVNAGTSESDYSGNVVFTATFTAKAAGTATLTLVEDSDGTDGYIATVATQTLTIKSATPAHTCTPTKVTGQAATCTIDGWKDYYQCSDTTCGKLYADADATSEITNLEAWKAGDGKIAAKDHTHAKYDDITATTHQSYCSCGAKIGDAAAHDYTTGASDYTCACGDVQEFTLNVTVYANDESVNLTVEYGANLLEVLAKAAEDEKIPAIGEKIRVNTGEENGYRIPTYYEYFVDGEWNEIDAQSTMPGEDIRILQNYAIYGWYYSYDYDDGSYVGAEYYEEDGDWLGDGGWYYIEENFDDVEGGAWYYFEKATGEWGGYTFRAEGLTRVPYPTVEINGITYKANAEDVAYAANNEDSKYTDATTAVFVFDADGKFQNTLTGIKDGSYVKNGMIAWHPGLVEVDDVLYYFVADTSDAKKGNILANGDVWVTRTNDVDGLDEGCYNFKDGQVNTDANGIVDGYYYKNGERLLGAGLVKIEENKYIYVRSGGQLAKNNYWVVKTNGLDFEVGSYNFDTNGYLVSEKGADVNGIVGDYYYKNGNPYYAGLIEIDGAVYYVNSSGKVIKNQDYYITKTNGLEVVEGFPYQSGDKLTFDADGKVQPMKEGVVDGVDADGNAVKYYYENNHLQCGAGVVMVKDENGLYYIYVRSNGTLATGIYYPDPDKLNGHLEPNVAYDFGEDGRYYGAE